MDNLCVKRKKFLDKKMKKTGIQWIGWISVYVNPTSKPVDAGYPQ